MAVILASFAKQKKLEIIKSEESPFCRVCYESGENPLISPCFCSGTSKYIHEDCLKQWIIFQSHGETNPKCEVCKYEYKTRTVTKNIFNYSVGIKRHFGACLAIPILIFGLVLMVIILIIVSLLKLNFLKDPGSSYFIVCVLGLLIIMSIILLIISCYKVCIVTETVEWRILPHHQVSK